MPGECESSKKEILLNGELSWSTRLKTMLIIDDIMKNQTTDALKVIGQEDTQTNNEKIAKNYEIKNLRDAVMHTISPSDSFVKLLEKFTAAYGFANTDPSVFESKLRTIHLTQTKILPLC
jgi:hypothetical protein